ncbi:TPA: hypothetical protein ACSVRT_002235 [Clostridioides difficile]|uniref:hypothetical protein n=1 Tax=Clostridioides difficile TaxID=1496 RepID=UPI0010342407|nr:hypothetical protein [Clostridioides difficile]MDX5779185.1 hypothetical protein [Clostridioides difficile]
MDFGNLYLVLIGIAIIIVTTIRYLIGLEYIAIGLFTRRLDITILAIILVAIITTALYYLIRKKYITI